jgi:hypothetical protein
MYDDEAGEEAKMYWASAKGNRSCVDFVRPLRRGTLNAFSEAVVCNEKCSAAMAAGLADVATKRISLREPGTWTLATTQSMALETPAEFEEQGQVCVAAGSRCDHDNRNESSTDDTGPSSH